MERKKMGYSNIGIALVYFLIGLLMLINPSFVCNALNYVIGSVIIVIGLIYIFRLLQNKSFKELGKIDLIISLLCFSFGLFFILNPNILTSILPICAAIIIFIDAISQISDSIYLKRMTNKTWYINLIIGLIFLSISIFIIINAPSVTHFLVRILGGVIFLDSIFEFYTYFKLREYNDIVKLMDNVIDSK